jgi:glycogen synthase
MIFEKIGARGKGSVREFRNHLSDNFKICARQAQRDMAQQRVRTEYSLDKMANKYLEEYEKVLSTNR